MTAHAPNEPLLTALAHVLDWHQLRVVLSEALGGAPAGTPDRWTRVAEIVNARCPGSRPRSAEAVEHAIHQLAALPFPAASRLETDPTVGRDVWTRLFYEMCRGVFDTRRTFLNLGYEGPRMRSSRH